jgi:hypothetical protein
MDSLAAELVANGIVGGPTVIVVIELARTEVRKRVEGVTAALLRACDSLDVRPTARLEHELSSHVRAIAAPILTLVQTNPSAVLLLRAQPNPADGERAFYDNVDAASRVALDAADAEITHYVESLSSRRRRSRWEVFWRIVSGLGGVVFGILATKLADHFWPTPH